MRIFITSAFILLIAAFNNTYSYAWTGEIISSYNLPGKFPTGLTYDGKNIWLADRMLDQLFCIDPTNGKVILSIKSPAYWPTGLAWDGKNLWNADVKGGIPLAENYNGKIYEINPANGTILNVIQSPSPTPRGLAWDGKYLWCADNSKDEIIQFSAEDGTTIRSFKAPASDAQGLAFDGKYLWISDRIRNEIYMVDTTFGNVVLITDAPGPFTNALCYDGQFLWAADYQNDKLYKLKVRDEEQYRKTNERKAGINFIYQGTNYGPGKVNTLDVYIAMPADRTNQKIDNTTEFSPSCKETVTDKWGQKLAHYSFKNIVAGESETIEEKISFSVWDVRWFIYPENVGTLDKIPEDIRKKYIENNEKYHLDHAVIKEAVTKATGTEKNPFWIARKLFNYLIAHMKYEMTGGWNTAPAVLERETGSCSEYSFVYISLCRAAGIPARYVGSLAMRGDAAAMDDVYHRWVEIYLPSYGWVPVDPSGGDNECPREQGDAFGSLENRFLITTEGGGASEYLLWNYNSQDFYTSEPKTFYVSETFADWEPK